MTRYQQLMEDLIFELLVEKRFNIKLLEEMMQIRAPGPYRLETSSTDWLDISKIKILFDDQCDKTEWILKWS